MNNHIIPMVVEQTQQGERSYDLYSMLMKERIIMVTTPVDDAMSSIIVGQLLYLQSIDPDKDINMYINSPGGSVSAGLAIYDTMQFVRPDIATIGMGICASMAQVLLCAGTKGKRHILANTEVMMHQPLGGTQGQASDIEIYTKQMLKTRTKLYNIISKHSGQPFDKILKDAERDNYMDPKEAIKYGLVDNIIGEIVKTKPKPKKKKS